MKEGECSYDVIEINVLYEICPPRVKAITFGGHSLLQVFLEVISLLISG